MGKFTTVNVYLTIDKIGERKATNLKNFLEERNVSYNVEESVKSWLRQNAEGSQRVNPYTVGVRIE